MSKKWIDKRLYQAEELIRASVDDLSSKSGDTYTDKDATRLELLRHVGGLVETARYLNA